MSLRERLQRGVRTCAAVLLFPFRYQPASPWYPAVIYGAMALALVVWNVLGEATPGWAWVMLPGFGLVIWTLLEYVLHSRFFHDPPRGFRWMSVSHGSHHDVPDDPKRVVAHLSFSFPFSIVLFGVLSVGLWNPAWAGLVLTGTIAGYLSYEPIHYSIHQVPAVRRLLRPLASHHLHHHYADPSRCFGVTSPIWDWVFRTGRRHRVVVSHAVEPSVSTRPGDGIVG